VVASVSARLVRGGLDVDVAGELGQMLAAQNLDASELTLT
jgi:hypothetical protein